MLAKLGLIHHRDMVRFFRYAVVIILILSALLTPPDPLSQMLMAVPLIFLYALSIGVAYVFSTKALDENGAENGDGDDDEKDDDGYEKDDRNSDNEQSDEPNTTKQT